MKRFGVVAALLVSLSPFVIAAPQQQHAPTAPGATETTARDLHSQLAGQSRTLVIDVRTPEEYAKGHIPEAINIPIDELTGKLQQLQVSKDRPIVTVCDRGGRSSRAALLLQRMGYQATSFCRLESWEKHGYKVSKGNSNAP